MDLGPPCPLVNEIEFVDLDVHSKDIAKALSVVELIGNQTIERNVELSFTNLGSWAQTRLHSVLAYNR